MVAVGTYSSVSSSTSILLEPYVDFPLILASISVIFEGRDMLSNMLGFSVVEDEVVGGVTGREGE